MSSHFDYCLAKAAPAGSNLYYSLIFESQESKSILIPLYAFHNELIDCLIASPDPGVTRLKFNWWHEELSRLSEKSPRHPVTQAINSLSVSIPNLISILHEHLVFIESIITSNQNFNFNEWLQHNIHGLGKFWLILNAFHNEESDTFLLIENGGLIFSLEILAIYPLFVGKSSTFLPEELSAKAGKANGGNSSPIMFEEPISYYHDNLTQTYLKLKDSNPKPALFNLILNRLANKICHEILLDGNRIMKHKIQLTPIRKLWISYLTRLSY